jgi:sugar phosphate isomerase/epimerase
MNGFAIRPILSGRDFCWIRPRGARDGGKIFAINLDIGHFTAGNNDAVDFLRKHHDRITHIHIKDRKRTAGRMSRWYGRHAD